MLESEQMKERGVHVRNQLPDEEAAVGSWNNVTRVSAEESQPCVHCHLSQF